MKDDKQDKSLFRHESLQSIDGVQDILKAIIKGLGKGLLSFRDEDGEIRLGTARPDDPQDHGAARG